MNAKKISNITALKVKFLGLTETKPARIKITQLNINKSVIIESEDQAVLQQVFDLLNKCDSVLNYNVIVDNTQDNYYLIGVYGHENRIDDYIIEIKGLLK